ncbi:MAG: hypothetical protein IPN85_05105 [Flavobacteriales bacterium]|nr:hypothetical protein [Flavobacteriales bacterium]
MDITGQLDHLLMPRVDLSTAPFGTTLTSAGAHRPTMPSTDRLMVKASTDCGATWTTLYDQEGTALATGTPFTGAFTPNATQWRNDYVDLAAVLGQPDVLFMFETESNYGNNMYIDDVRIANSVGIAESGAEAFGLFPNPNTGAFSIRANSALAGTLEVRVLAVDGSLAQQRTERRTRRHLDSIQVPARGSYLVELIHASGTRHRMPVVVY